MFKISLLPTFLILWLFVINCSTSEEDLATCELDENGKCVENGENDLDSMSTHERIAYLKRLGEKEKKEKEEQGIPLNDREMKVLFQNKSGRKTKLWWKGPNENVLQADMDSPGETVKQCLNISLRWLYFFVYPCTIAFFYFLFFSSLFLVSFAHLMSLSFFFFFFFVLCVY